MPTNDERREAARILRDMCERAAPGNREWHTYTCYIEVDNYLAKHGARGLPRSVADLIDPDTIPANQDKTEHPLSEPEIDRERLLAIAELMDADSVRSAKKGSSVSPVYILHAARNIAEACGETFGSIRNRDLTKWGTSIVPKETIADRDALLALADEIDRKSDDGTVNPDPMKPIASSLDLFGYARRIREAVGE